MFLAILTAAIITLLSILGALFFSKNKAEHGIERFVVPLAVGFFLSLIFLELIPETLSGQPNLGGVVVVIGFLSFYALSNFLHNYFHKRDDDKCDRKSAANLLLIGDGVHNLADGVVLATAFLINPGVGVVTAIGLALHEIPQEIVEFGVLIRSGYNRTEAILRNLLSASTIIFATALTFFAASVISEWMWVITGLAAGNLLYLATADLLPHVHSTTKKYGSFWYAFLTIILGFILMSFILTVTHEKPEYGYENIDIHETHQLIHH